MASLTGLVIVALLALLLFSDVSLAKKKKSKKAEETPKENVSITKPQYCSGCKVMLLIYDLLIYRFVSLTPLLLLA